MTMTTLMYIFVWSLVGSLVHGLNPFHAVFLYSDSFGSFFGCDLKPNLDWINVIKVNISNVN